MCEFINAVGNWLLANPSLIVSIVAVIVALAIGRNTIAVMKKQALEERKERHNQALAEQRYAIFQQLMLLSRAYSALAGSTRGVNIIEVQSAGTSINIIAVRHRLETVLGLPTNMTQAELNTYVSYCREIGTDQHNASAYKTKTDAQIENVAAKLNPELVKLFKITT